MKHLFFAGSFAISAILSYGWNNEAGSPGTEQAIARVQTYSDTTPKKKDTLKKRKYPGKDSLNRKDTTRPIPDTTNR